MLKDVFLWTALFFSHKLGFIIFFFFSIVFTTYEAPAAEA